MPEFRTMADVEAYLAAHTDYEKMTRFADREKAFRLDRIRALLSELGDPQQAFRIAHVAGTKGKGSTCHMIAAILQASGRKTGLFTSPHLVSLRERIRVGGGSVSETDLCHVMDAVARARQAVAARFDQPPTFFELILAASCECHRRAGISWGTYEVGLGGRLDATNVLPASVTAITTLGLDHTHVLGDTIEKIATEKAGILKPGVPLVLSPSETPAMKVVLKQAKSLSAPVWLPDRDIRFHATPVPGGAQVVSFETPGFVTGATNLPLAGLHQAQNAATAVGVAVIAATLDGPPLEPGQLSDGLAAVRVPGRLQKVRDNPTLVVDTAHNAMALRTILEALGDHHTFDALHVVMGASRDKDLMAMMHVLRPAAATIRTVSAGTPRSTDPEFLARLAREAGCDRVQALSSVGEGVDASLAQADPADLVLVTGSFYVAGAAFRHLGITEL